MKSKLLLLMLTFCFIFTGLTVSAQYVDMLNLYLLKSFNKESVESTKVFSAGENCSILKEQLYEKEKTGSIVMSFIKLNGDLFKTVKIDVTGLELYFRNKLSNLFKIFFCRERPMIPMLPKLSIRYEDSKMRIYSVQY